jgi:hypothetical protein
MRSLLIEAYRRILKVLMGRTPSGPRWLRITVRAPSASEATDYALTQDQKLVTRPPRQARRSNVRPPRQAAVAGPVRLSPVTISASAAPLSAGYPPGGYPYPIGRQGGVEEFPNGVFPDEGADEWESEPVYSAWGQDWIPQY